MKQKWETYEEVAKYLLDQAKEHFSLKRVEGKQILPGLRTGTNWEIDAKGVREDAEGFVIIECRRHTTAKQKQKDLAALAYSIIDTGAGGGILVSPLDVQKGAKKVAAAENIFHVYLDENSTPTDFALRFLNKVMVGISSRVVLDGSASAEVKRVCNKCKKRFIVTNNERICPDCRT